jgi:hypothetical protein
MPLTTVSVNARRRALLPLRLGVLAALLGLVAACGDSTTAPTAASKPDVAVPAGKLVSAATLKPGQSVPLPAEKPVLKLSGKISATNQGGELVFDLPTIERLGVEQVGLYEPWVKENLEFRGVWLQHLLAVAGVHADATRVHIVAHDDYTVDLTLADIRAGGIMLATRSADGSAITIDHGGPTRIVFLDGVKAGANADQWIWSIKAINVQ